MRGDTWSAFGQARAMIFCAEHGLHFAKEGDHWRRYRRVSGVTSLQPLDVHLNSF